MQAPEPLAFTSSLSDISWSIALHKPILVTVDVLHVVTAVYFVLFGLILFQMTPFQARLFRGSFVQLSATAYFLVAMLHLVPLVQHVVPDYLCSQTSNRIHSLHRPTMHVPFWHWPKLPKLASHVKVCLRHVIEISGKSWMAC
ncbi:Aste57867_547 [Aphanomyces stellatus]|uniref:Aste57867_547 protein n=1 Tax=Aphanomyces stellatus TaxID=120398 RepID=A0A485K835_9STRA|nr:hypothetical protein As57867_000546 [Aphanomyces stellatus]VFT77772.1 Aste57867_547 [Aphanomyces stellatus]